MNKKRPLDEHGWMIPKGGTLARQVYDLAKLGYTSRQIAIHLNQGEAKVSVIFHRIRNPGLRETYGLGLHDTPT